MFISYFCCYLKIPDKKQLEAGFYLAHSLMVQSIMNYKDVVM